MTDNHHPGADERLRRARPSKSSALQPKTAPRLGAMTSPQFADRVLGDGVGQDGDNDAIDSADELEMIRVAIIEDDPATIDLLRSAIEPAENIEIAAVARNVMTGVKLIAAGGYDVLLCDLGLPDGSGIALIRESATRYPAADVIVITIFADQAKVLDSIKAGARGYLLKDEQFADCVEGIREIRRGGSPISPIIARQLLLQIHPATRATIAPLKEGLSPRELEILNLLARGFSNIEIGELISISKLTVGTHVKNIYRKLEVNSRSEAVFEASSRGIMNAH
ncbi:response regulator [Sphingomonas pruni]|uniref:response regulator n=1 Tax=Sphingomonas pruni TaxID=40683 RepID=UPI00082D7D20|nr:response regulator transcription factor [Sphingomonas pruni]